MLARFTMCFKALLAQPKGWSIGKHLVILHGSVLLWQPFLCLNSQGYDDRAFGLLHGWYVNDFPRICLLNVPPVQRPHVAVAQSCKAAKQEGLFCDGTASLGISQGFQFFNRQIFPEAWCLLELLTSSLLCAI